MAGKRAEEVSRAALVAVGVPGVPKVVEVGEVAPAVVEGVHAASGKRERAVTEGEMSAGWAVVLHRT